MIDKTINAHIDDLSPLVIPATEGDTMWRWDFRLFFEGQRWTIPSGSSAMITGMKPDGNVFEYAATIADNEARVACTTQMTAVAGSVHCSLRVLDGSEGILAVKNFVLAVTPAPQNGVTPSETVLQAYAEALAELNRAIAGLDVSCETLDPGDDATVAVTGGGTSGEPYNIHFGIPTGETGPAASVQGTTVKYSTSDSGTVRPTSWSSSPNPTKGKYLWTKTTVSTTGGDFDVIGVSYLGTDGNGAVDSVNGYTGDVDIKDIIKAQDFQVTSSTSSKFPASYNLTIPFTIPSGYEYFALTEITFGGGVLPYVTLGVDTTTTPEHGPYVSLYCGIANNTNMWNTLVGATVTARILFIKSS